MISQLRTIGQKGFIFEYSATFKEVANAAARTDIAKRANAPNAAAYAKNILFDYSYRCFHQVSSGRV